MNKMVILYVDDWSVLYVNGEEVKQSHMIEISDIVKYCPITSIKEEWVNGELDDFVQDSGRFPSLSRILEGNPNFKILFEE